MKKDRLLLEEILLEIKKLQLEVFKMAVSQTQFDTDLAKFGTDYATLLGLVNQLIALVQAGSGTPVDLTTEDTGVNSMDSSALSAIAAAQAVIPPSTPSAQIKK